MQWWEQGVEQEQQRSLQEAQTSQSARRRALTRLPLAPALAPLSSAQALQVLLESRWVMLALPLVPSARLQWLVLFDRLQLLRRSCFELRR